MVLLLYYINTNKYKGGDIMEFIVKPINMVENGMCDLVDVCGVF